jgi:hypothetical protein
MFLGRSTIQWTGLISAAVSTLQVLIVTLVPGVDPVAVAVVLGTIGGFLGVLIAFIANTSTTPVKDPQLVEGTSVRVTNAAGTIIGHSTVQSPSTESGA